MVLYHASTMYHLLSCIVHKLAFEQNDEAELLLLEYIKPEKERKEFLEKLLRYGFFSKVRYVPEQQFKLSKGIALNEQSTPRQINTVIDNISGTFADWFGEDIKKYREIYVASDQHSFGIFLIKNKIPYTYMEDASGMLSEQARYLSITKSNNLTNNIVNEYLGCMGRSDCVKAKLCDIKHQKKGFFDKKAVDFSIYSILKNIIPNKIPVLLEFFGNIIATVRSDKKVCLFLTQDLNTLKIKDLDLQELTMTLLVDYLCPEHTLVIKPHPKDRWQNYRRIFPDGKLLEKAVPSELLPFAIDGEIDLALTASSTSVRGMSEFARRCYYFTTEIETNRERIDDMYVATEVLKELGIKDGIRVQNINEEQIINFLDNAKIKRGGDEVVIDGGIKKQEPSVSNAKRLELRLNLGNVLNFDPDKSTENLYIINADFIPKDGSLMDEKQIMIFAYCYDFELLPTLQNLKLKRHLKYTKAEINVWVQRCEKENAEKLKAKLMRDLEWEEF